MTSKSVMTSLKNRPALDPFPRTILNSLLHDCWCMDIHKRYNYQNSASRANWGDVIGLTIDELDIKEELKRFWKREIDSVFRGERIESEYYAVEYDMWFRSVIIPLHEQGKITGAAGITIDISEHRKQEEQIEQQNAELKALNSTLNVLIKKISDDMRSREEFLSSMIENSIMPIIDSLKETGSRPDLVAELEEEILGLIPPDSLDTNVPLTKTERLVAELIRTGKTSKEIAEKLNVELSTVFTHRNNIRKKLNLKKSNIGLFEYLNTV